MATKRKNQNGDWSISIQSLGFNTTFSARTTSTKHANRILREIESRIDSVKIDGAHPFHSWPKKEQVKWLKTGLEPRTDSGPLTLFSAVDDFLTHKRATNKAPVTVQGYELFLQAAKDFFGDIAVEDLSARKLQDWADNQASTVITNGKNRAQLLAPTTIKKKLNQLKSVVKWFHSHGVPNLRPEAFGSVSIGVKTATSLDKLNKYDDFDNRCIQLQKLGIEFDREGAFKNIILDKKQFMQHIEDLKQKLFVDGSVVSIRVFCAVLVAVATGARRAELCRLCRSDFDLDADIPTLQITKLKGRGTDPYLRQISALPITHVPYLRKLFRILPANQKSVFCSDDSHIVGDSFDESVETGVPEKANYLTNLLKKSLATTRWEHSASWHLYRHTLASHLLMEGYSQNEVENQIGWCSSEMAKRYQHSTVAHRSTIINTIFP